MCTHRHSMMYHLHKPLIKWFAWHPVKLAGLQRQWAWFVFVDKRKCALCGWIYQRRT